MKLLALLLVLSLFFFAGVIVTHYQLFPYPQIKKVKQYFFSKETSVVHINHDYYFRKVSQHQMQKGQRVDVLLVGDSLMDEADWHYFFSNSRVANFGINADTTSGVLKRIESITDINADKLFLMIGINDIFLHTNMSSIQENYQHIIEHLAKQESTVYILACLYVGARYSQYNTHVRELNQFIEGVAMAHKGVTYIDLNPQLAPDNFLNPTYTNDGIHLNHNAYQRWADAIESYINE